MVKRNVLRNRFPRYVLYIRGFHMKLVMLYNQGDPVPTEVLLVEQHEVIDGVHYMQGRTINEMTTSHGRTRHKVAELDEDSEKRVREWMRQLQRIR